MTGERVCITRNSLPWFFHWLSSLILNSAAENGFKGVYAFKRGTEIDLHFLIYNPPSQPEKLAQRVKLLDAADHVLLDSELPIMAPAQNGAAATQGTRFKVPTARGRYALIVTVRDAAGKIDLERRADLVVE